MTVVLVFGVAILLVGVVHESDQFTLLGVLLALPQAIEAVLGLLAERRPLAKGLTDRRELARRMLEAHAAEEIAPSIPGGDTIDLDYRSEDGFATFRSCDQGTVRFDGLVAAVKEAAGPLVLIGAPGAGKTLTARRLVTALLAQAAAAGNGALAERFSLSRWSAIGDPLEEWLAREWSGRQDHGLRIEEARRLVIDPAVVIVLDGLDEVSDQHRRSCVAAINAFIDVHPTARLVVCCREEEYRMLDERVESRRVRRIVPLEAHTIHDFIAEHAPPTWMPVRQALAHDTDLRALLNTPLMLVAALRSLRDDPSVLLTGSQGERQQALWDCYIESMLRVGGWSTGGEDRHRWLEDVAITMVATGTYELVLRRSGPREVLGALSAWRVGRRRSPRRLRAFLDGCVDRHLLRRTASGYQCFHRQLLGHLVARASFDVDRNALRRRLLVRAGCEGWAWNRLAAEAMAAGHYEVATQMARRALRVVPGHPAFLRDLAFYLLLVGRLEDAAGVAGQAEAADPTDWRPASTQAYALFALGDVHGSAAARQRAWAKGHQPSDGSLLAYAFELLGRHDEAVAVLDELGAPRRDDGFEIARVLALRALGREIEAAQALFPLDIEQIRSVWMIFAVPYQAAERLLPGNLFEAVEVEPGFTQLVLSASDNRRTPWGQYLEIDLAILARPAGAPEETTGAFGWRSFANQKVGREAAFHTLTFPVKVADARVSYTDETVAFRLVIDAQEALTLTVPRADPSTEDDWIDAVVYTCVAGVPYVMAMGISTPKGVVDPRDVAIEVGTGELAELLRTLGLPKEPDYCAWGEDVTATFHLARPLAPDVSDKQSAPYAGSRSIARARTRRTTEALRSSVANTSSMVTGATPGTPSRPTS